MIRRRKDRGLGGGQAGGNDNGAGFVDPAVPAAGTAAGLGGDGGLASPPPPQQQQQPQPQQQPATATAPIGFGALAKGKRGAPIVRGGILGCIQRRIFNDMFDAVPDSYKILICDKEGATIISTCMRVHQLMEHGVTLVEDLFLERQPLVCCPALYFLSPTEESVRRLLMDWTTKKCYREAHVFFTSATPDRFVNTMAGMPLLAANIKTLKDMMLDFAVPERLLFHLGMPADLPKLFPQEIALAGGRENILGQVAARLASVFFTIDCGVPLIRYQGASRLAQTVARGLYDELARMAKDTPGFRIGATTPDTPLLLLVDRSFDPAEVLLHERTYQCLLDDLMPLTGGVYEQTVTSRAGETSKKTFPIDEQDPYWCQFRHQPFSTCIVELPKLLDELIKANPGLANGLQSTIGMDANRLAALGGAIRALPEFQEKQAKLSLHIDICSKLMDAYRAQRLTEVCEVEQDIAAERRPFRDLCDSVRRLAGDGSLPMTVRVRLLLLLFAVSNTRELSEAKKQQLIQEAGLMNDAVRAANLEMFTGGRVGRLKPDAATAAPGTPAKAEEKGGASLTSLRRSLRRGASPGNSATSAGAGASQTAAPAVDPYQSQAYLILNAAVTDTLSTADFPALNAALGGGAGGDARGAAGGASQRRTLRAGLSRMGDGAGAGGGGTATSLRGGALDNAVLDLGHEGQFPLKRSQKVVLFVLGGCTYGEARAAYTVAKESGAEVIVGGTSLLKPEVFVTQLASLR